MTDIEIVLVLWLLTLIAFLMMGAAMLGALHGQRRRANYWQNRANLWERQAHEECFRRTELKRNSHRRDPKTGRLMKKGL
jgi:Tfp pilus assembly protein PilV